MRRADINKRKGRMSKKHGRRKRLGQEPVNTLKPENKKSKVNK